MKTHNLPFDSKLNVIDDVLQSYVDSLNELSFILKYQPNKYKAYCKSLDILNKFSDAGLYLPGEIINLIMQYLLR